LVLAEAVIVSYGYAVLIELQSSCAPETGVLMSDRELSSVFKCI
jgi:hypothetical protein